MVFRELRKKKGLTAEYVAEKLGIKTTTLTRKERENRFTTLQIQVLCSLYDVRPEDINI